MTHVVSTNAEFDICKREAVIPSCHKEKPFCIIDAVCVGAYKCLCFYSSETPCTLNADGGQISISQHRTLKMN